MKVPHTSFKFLSVISFHSSCMSSTELKEASQEKLLEKS